MSLPSLTLLEKYAAHPFPMGYPTEEHVTLYAPDDRIPEALRALLASAEHSIVMAMYGLDDEQVVDIILEKMKSARVFVQISLDSTQAGGKHEKAILDHAQFPGNTVAIGQSEKHAIQHMKQTIIDSLDVIGGSTNESVSGETRQDNEFTVDRHPIIAARARWKCDLIHASMTRAAQLKLSTE